MNILYCGDSNIADGVIISSVSLTKMIKAPIHFYILTAEVEYNGIFRPALQSDFCSFLQKELQKYNAENTVRLIDITEKFKNQKPNANMDTRFTPCCMLRLYADEVDELPSKILYLDNDVICCENPTQFYNQDMSDSPIAGVLDHYGSWFFRQKFYKRDYLNSGVLLLNMPKIKESKLFKDSREMCMNKKMFMPDQSALNKLCKNKIICKRKYNEQRRLHKDTVFQHFTTSFRFLPYFHSVNIKPWNIEGMHKILKLHEYDNLLDEYLVIKQKYIKEKPANEQI